MQPTIAASKDLQHSATGSGRESKSLFAMTPLAMAMVAVLHPGSVVAQESAEKPKESSDKEFVIEEITVTATKREESLQDLDQSITAFGTDAIEKMKFNNMEDYLKALPSASLTSSMPGRNSLMMRGISSGAYEYRTESQVAVYLDDQPITSISQQPDVRMVDIARVENLPGPQGTLFGSSSQSGTMRIITNKPNTDGFSGQVNAQMSSTSGGDPSWDFNGHLNIPVSDKLAIRVVGFAAHEGGYVDNVYGETYVQPELGLTPGNNAAVVEDNQNTYDITGGRIAALWQINDNWENETGFISQTSKANGTWQSDPALGDYKIIKFYDEWRDDSWWQASTTFRGDLGFAEFTSTTSYFERDSSYAWDYMAYFQWGTSYARMYGWLPYDFNYESGGTTFNDQIQTRFAQEFRLVSQSESKLQWMVGAFYDDTYDEWEYGFRLPDGVLGQTNAWYAANYSYYGACYYAANGYDVPCPLPATDITYWNNMKRTIKQTAVFGEISYDITDKLTATVGGRWFQNDRDEFQQYYQPYGKAPYGSFGAGEGLYTSKGSNSDTVKKFSLKYAFDNSRMAYFTLSEGFRLGGTNSPRAAATGWIAPTYDPDKLTNYEVGVKTEWLDRRLTLNASAFYMEWDKIQINSRVGPTWHEWWLRGTWNGKTGESKGLEINGTFYVTQNFVLEGSVYTAKSKYTADTYSPRCPESDPDCDPWIYDGQAMPGAPDLKYWLAAEYTIPNAFGIPGDLWFRFDTSYQSETYNSLTSAVEKEVDPVYGPVGLIPSWRSSNVQVGVSLDSDWTISLMARNVFDDRGINDLSSSSYYSDYFEGITGQDPGWGRYTRTIQKPRTISLSVTKKF